MDCLDEGILDGPVHPFGLAVSSRVTGLSKPVLDAVLFANAIEDVAAKHFFHIGMATSAFMLVGGRHTVVD